MTRLVLGDDHRVFLDALSSVLLQRGYAVTVAASITETIEVVGREKPDLCLIDRHFAAGDGIGAIAALIAASPATKILVLSADCDADGVRRAVWAGASGYQHKSRGISALTKAIERVLRGETVVDVPLDAPLRLSDEQESAQWLASYLTPRELECLALLVEGLGTAAIAARLGLSSNTVRSHIQMILTTLGVHSRLEAATLAVRYHLLDASTPTAVGADGF